MQVSFLVSLVLYALLLPALCLGETLYVNPASGADANNGLAEFPGPGGQGPWKNLAHAMLQLAPGDVLVLADGTHYGCDLRFAVSGKRGAPITLKAATPGKAVIDGSRCPGKENGIFVDQGKGHYLFEGLTVQNMPGNGIASDENSTTLHEGIVVRGCTLRKNGLSGLELAAVRDFAVQNLRADSNGYYGLNVIGSLNGVLSSSRGKILQSSFDNHTGPEGHGMAINQGQEIEVRNCSATHNRIHGFDVSDWPKGGALSSRIVFANNRSYNNGKGGFAVNSDSSQVEFIRNVAWNNGARWAGKKLAPGFWCYEGCRDCLWLNNTAVGNSLAGFQIEGRAGEYDRKPPTTKLTLMNNISWDNGVAEWDEMWALWVSRAGWQLTLKNNNFGTPRGGDSRVVGLEMVEEHGRTFTGQDIEAGKLPQANMSREPQFRNAKAGDFRLRKGSPMINAGAPALGTFCGGTPDIGAFEFCQ